jgi:NADP-dependent 3-hydroxy acid dehydrogenase YdfG
MAKITWSNKVAIVSGASSGIGRATALELARRGVRVALAARHLTALQELASQVKALGSQALVVPTDVTQQIQVDELVERTTAQWGRVDMLVSNAGQYIRSPVTSLQVSQLEQSLAVNFYGGVYAVLAVLPCMLQQKSGHIVMVTSMDGKKGIPPDAPYAAAKYALTGFTDILRQELRGTGIFVTTILPGRVDTPMVKDLAFPAISAKITPETVAKEILRGIERHKAEVILPPQAKLLYVLNTLSPELADWAIKAFKLSGWKK